MMMVMEETQGRLGRPAMEEGQSSAERRDALLGAR